MSRKAFFLYTPGQFRQSTIQSSACRVESHIRVRGHIHRWQISFWIISGFIVVFPDKVIRKAILSGFVPVFPNDVIQNAISSVIHGEYTDEVIRKTILSVIHIQYTDEVMKIVLSSVIYDIFQDERMQRLTRSCIHVYIQQNTPSSYDDRVSYKKVAATYSPTWWGSTIGDGELNFSVRNGKRWILTAITATVCFWEKTSRSTRLDQ